ncbi:MAG: Rossmann-like and DUF2520 domain-containing protein [Syntrophorhabdales bacterium]|jgi:predicted short-subunit dehydrogenase-like oxidoreductase (DUF2520 family)
MRIGIIGAGKVGCALGYTLKKKGFEVAAVADVRPSSLDAARAYIGEDCFYTGNNLDVAEMAEVVAVTTQDKEIRNVAAQISSKAGRLDGKLFFHTSGAHDARELSPLEKNGALLGSLHPLQTFPDIDAGIAALPETYIFIEGDEKALPLLKLLGSNLGAKVEPIESKNKVLYHLCAVFVCNLLSALFFAAQGIVKRIGIDLPPFYPIIRATLANIEAKGPLLSLTGPVVRGDSGTISSHIKALEGMGLTDRVYRVLSLVALDMARERKTLTKEEIEALGTLLEGGRLPS